MTTVPHGQGSKKKGASSEAKKEEVGTDRAHGTGDQSGAGAAKTSKQYEKTTDPAKVESPVMRVVHNALTEAWKIYPSTELCFIFDAVSPARQFKRGTLYHDDLEFADYGPEPWDELTETDTTSPGWLPYKPELYTYVL